MITWEQASNGDVYVRKVDDVGSGPVGFILNAGYKEKLALVVWLFEGSTPAMVKFENLRVVEYRYK